MITRNEYLEKLKIFKDKELIKVVTGIRRCGKSTLFKQYQEYLLKSGIKKEQIIDINFEDIDYENLTDYKNLYNYIKNRLIPDKKNYIFLDEIQHVNHFEKAADALYIKENTDIYITGSNAYFLSGELATLLSGRYVEIKMLPLSFKEYSSALDSSISIEKKFSMYMQEGGFPYLLNLTDTQAKKDYLEGIYSTIVLKDTAARKKISDISLLQTLIKFMFDNIGSITSPKKISDTLTSAGRKTAPQTIESCLSALQDSFILYKSDRYDISGRQILKTNSKYYTADLGLQQYILSRSKRNIGHNLENIIYLELIRRGYRVYTGKTDNAEIDFAAEKDSAVCYYQVSQTVMDETVLRRELAPLNKLKDHNQKFLLTMDILPEISHNGIRQINAVDWLLGDYRR